MTALKLKENLKQIADRINEKTSIEDVFKELSLLIDIEESEEQEKNGEIYSQKEVETLSKQWLK